MEFRNNWLGIREIQALISQSLCSHGDYWGGGAEMTVNSSINQVILGYNQSYTLLTSYTWLGK